MSRKARAKSAAARPSPAPVPVPPPPPGLLRAVRPILAFVALQAALLSAVVWLARRNPGRIETLWPPEAQVVLLVLPGGLPGPADLPALKAIASGRAVGYVALRREDVPDLKIEWLRGRELPPGPILSPGVGLGDGTPAGLLRSVGLEKLRTPPWVIVPAGIDDSLFLDARLRVLRVGKPRPADAPERSIIGSSDWNEARKVIETSRSTP